jgi:hypothetical protein
LERLPDWEKSRIAKGNGGALELVTPTN